MSGPALVWLRDSRRSPSFWSRIDRFQWFGDFVRVDFFCAREVPAWAAGADFSFAWDDFKALGAFFCNFVTPKRW